MTKEKGGPAFPDWTKDGMTLRDYFAAKAMQAHVQREDVFTAIAEDRLTPDQVCDGCYKWADLMLKAREQ